MPNILAIETSSPLLSIALKTRKGRIFEKSLEGYYKHGENILVFIDQLLKKAHLKMKDIDIFLIGRGPGSFTGLRVGFATLKGFLAARKKPCYGALSLDIIAQGIDLPEGSRLGVLLDARREKIYARIYERRKNQWKAKKKPGVWSVEELTGEFPGEIHLAGDGLQRYGEEIKKSSVKRYQVPFGGNRKIHFLSESSWYPTASHLIELFEAGKTVQKLEKPKDFIPLYFRLTEAEEKRREHAATC
ncbi:MAG: tRNA (adenosine(37)-N6)-threonylcarbamoyltransferase complex dimerization subunit type 1 TsaB [Candidatus Omnitrophica bacterium]|nr:tRNA (adenosine(37)-N6)-threonylcarbamoyltransferase complex dimerization subunit type 1 TsaB [Candidatus Omnitrophota bacterium]